MEIEYRLSETDCLAATKLHVKAGPNTMIALSLLGLGLLGLAIFAPTIRLQFIAAMGFIGGVAGYFVCVYVIAPLSAKKQYRSSKTSGEPILLHFDDNGYSVQTPTGKANLPWHKLFKWRKNRDYVLIYLSTQLFHAIPRRLQSQGFDVSRLEALLEANLGRAK